MIPKIIHYCWFGHGNKTEMVMNCINSWKKYCTNYKIVEWNEDNFDINFCAYTKEAYDAKKWAFVSDVVRLYVLVKFGGIYMDTDVEVIKPLDDLLQYHAVSGFESAMSVSTGLMAAEKNNPFMNELLLQYENIHFQLPDGKYDMRTNVTRITNTCLKYGLKQNNRRQVVNSLTLLPSDYLCPKDNVTGKINKTSNTLTIHHFNGSWLSDEAIFARDLLQNDYSEYWPEALFPYIDVKSGSKVIIYGLGNFGRKIVKEMMSHEKYYRLIACSDKNWRKFKEEQYALKKPVRVIDPKEISRLNYDYIIVTVLDRETAKMISSELEKLGICKKSIILLDYEKSRKYLESKKK